MWCNAVTEPPRGYRLAARFLPAPEAPASKSNNITRQGDCNE
jgi:hypothetical protein